MNDNLPPLPFGDDVEAWLECLDAAEIRQSFIEYGQLCRQQALEEAAQKCKKIAELDGTAYQCVFVLGG